MNCELRERRDFNFSANIRISCGERYRHIFEDFEFVLRLTDLSNPNAEKSIEISKESFDLLVHYEGKIGELIDEGLKAIIFQQIEVQLFVWQYDEAVGYQAHLQDKQRTTISIDKETIAQLVCLQEDVEEEYSKYIERKFAKKKKRTWKVNKDEQPEWKKPRIKKPYTKRPYTKKVYGKKPCPGNRRQSRTNK